MKICLRANQHPDPALPFAKGGGDDGLGDVRKVDFFAGQEGVLEDFAQRADLDQLHDRCGRPRGVPQSPWRCGAAG